MANRTENVGIFTAYGFAREGGYVGTKAEFEEGLAKSANYATNAQASATAAANSATAASGSATAAAGSASTAAGYAQDADEAAQAAAASADEAEGYAESIDPDQFAKIDGYYGTLKSGESDTADNLTPYSSDSGTSQNTPFIDQGSGCANGEEQADTGSYCQLQRKNGNTVTVNQARTTRSGSYNLSATQYQGMGNEVTYLTYGHVYLVMFNAKIEDDNETPLLFAIGNAGYSQYQMLVANGWNCKAAILSDTFGTQVNDSRFFTTAAGLCHFSYSDISVIDLTLWFGSNDAIPTHLLNHPEDFFRYYQGDLSYNVGTLTDCNGRYLKAWKRNVWDEQTQTGYYDAGTGLITSTVSNTHISSLNKTKVISNTQYYLFKPSASSNSRICFYDGNENFIGYQDNPTGNVFTTPANCIYVNFSVWSYATSSVYKKDITLSKYYPGESGYDQYYPYEELANIDTGDEPLLAFDYKTPDGVVHKNTGKQALNTMTIVKVSDHLFKGTNIDPVAIEPLSAQVVKGLLAGYTASSYSVVSAGTQDKTFTYYANQLFIYDSAYNDADTFASAVVDKTLEYELKEPTTEQGTPFPENVAIDDFGTMSFDCPNGVPQGNTVFYPVDYKAEIDTLHNITEGDMHKIALKGDLAEGEPETIEEVIDYINARIPAPPAEDGTYNLTVTVASGEATYSWVSAT